MATADRRMKAEETDRAAYEIIGRESRLRAEKTARLREARAVAMAEPKAETKAAKQPRKTAKTKAAAGLDHTDGAH